MTIKTPPNSLEAEQAVLGCVMMFPACYDEVAYLAPEDFYYVRHRSIWELMRRDESCRDAVSVVMSLTDQGDKVYAGELSRSTATAANVKVYGQVIKDRAMLRRLLSECMGIIGDISEDARPADVVAGALRRIEAIGEGAIVGTGPRHIGELTIAWQEEFQKRKDHVAGSGIEIPFSAIQERWGGLRGGQVVVIAGRPKTGKTTLALNIAEHVAKTHPVAMFQMEMSASELVDRAVASAGGISISKIRAGDFEETYEWDSFIAAMSKLGASRLYIDVTPRQTIDYIRMHSKGFVKKYGKGLILIDYLGLIRANQTSRSKNDEIAEISRDIKLLAKETDCPVILLCQMNRGVEKEKRKPQLSDLRDSGAIEQDADVICFTHKDDPEQNYSEIITRAMRSGQPGTDYLMCDFGISRFTTPDPYWNPPAAEVPKARGKGLK